MTSPSGGSPGSAADLAGALRRSGLFRGLGAEALGAVARASAEVAARAGETLFQEGDPGDAMFVVLDGAVQVCMRDRAGAEVVLARLEPGAHFGEQALLPGSTGRRNATVRAASPVRLARVPKAAFEAALRDDDALHERLVALGDRQVREQLLGISALARALDVETSRPARRSLADGEVLFRQGDEADALYLVAAGRLAITREEAGSTVALGHAGRGECVGELALVRRERRAATVVADGPAEVVEVGRDRFERLYRDSDLLRDQIETLTWIYELPHRGLATRHQGRFAGADCITTLYDLPDGRRFAAYRVVGDDLYAIERLSPGVPPGGELPLVFTDEQGGRSRELRLAPDGTLVGVTARGLWTDAGALHVIVLDGGRLGADERERFLRTGVPWADRTGPAAAEARPGDDELCRCVGVTLPQLRAAIDRGAVTFDALQRETGCGTVCGGCVPEVVELLGEEQWVIADVVAVRDEAPEIRSFELAPRAAAFPPAEPGQHVVVEGLVRGVRVRRPYTVSSPRRSGGRIRITVKREEQGVFSRWLFDERGAGEPLRITRPRGDSLLALAPGRGPLVCMVAGIGVTPALAAAQTVADEGLGADVVVHYCGRARASMAGIAELEDAARRAPGVRLTLRETAREGRLGPADARALALAHPDATWFLCGPEPFLDGTARLLRDAGVADGRIRVEVFTPVGAPPPAAPARLGDEMRTAIERFMLVRPEPDPPRPLRQAARRAGVTLARVLNGPLTDWRVAGLQLNPLRIGARRLVAARAGLDPAVPYVHLGAVTVLSHGPFEYQTECFTRLAPRRAANRARAAAARARGAPLAPDTPDGDTFAYTTPAPPLVRFPPECMIDTGWDRVAAGWFLPIYVIRGRAALRHLLCTRDHTDRGAMPYYYFQQIIGQKDVRACPGRAAAGLFAGQFHDNRSWSDDRALTADMFGFPTIDAFGPGMAAALDEVCAGLDEAIARDPDAVIDLNVMMSKIAYTIILRAVFGDTSLVELHALGADLSHSIRELLTYLFQFVMGRQSVPDDYVDLWRRGRGAARSIIDLLRDLDRRGALTETQRSVPAVRAVLDAGDGDHDRLISLFLPLIIGGHETTGHTMSWAVYELARNPMVERLVVDEIDAFRAAHGGRALTTADYDERPVSLALLAEVLRRHSPIAASSRTTLSAGTTPPDPETGIGAFSYPAGAMIVCSVLAVHMDPARWPEPETFRIERFLDGDARDGGNGAGGAAGLVERGRRVRRTIRAREEALDLLAFADGPGRCPGQHFNAHEFLLVLDALLARYRFELEHPDRDVPHAETMVVGPEKGRMGVRIRRRAR